MTPIVPAAARARLAGALLDLQPDERLVELTRGGHDAAFEAIVRRHRRTIVRSCRSVLGDARAEDAAQQALLNAYRALLASSGPVELRPWLLRIARNAAIDLLRQGGFDHAELDERIDGVERPDQAAERRERFAALMAGVQALPDEQRAAIVLREFEGASHAEIGEALHVSGGAARQLVHRARVSLRAGAAALIPPGMLERLLQGAPSGSVEAVVVGGGGTVLVKAAAAALATGAIVAGGTTAVRHEAGPRPAVASAAQPASASGDPAGGDPGTPVAAATPGTHEAGRRSRGSRRTHRSHTRSTSDRRSGGDGSDDGSGSSTAGGDGRHDGGPERSRDGSTDGSGRHGSDGGSTEDRTTADDTTTADATGQTTSGGGSSDGGSDAVDSSSDSGSSGVTTTDGGSDGSDSGSSGSGSEDTITPRIEGDS